MLRRRRYSGYSSRYRRRRVSVSAVFRFILIVLLIGVIGYCAVTVYRAFRSSAYIAELESQNKTLQATVDRYQAALPDPSIAESIEPMDYQTLYPEMKVDPKPTPAAAPANTVYLTFDGGPSQNTATILDALKNAGQKATFFVVGKNIAGNEAIVKRIVDEGHTIGIRGYSNDYNAIYASPEAFLEDFHQAYQANYEQLIAEMLRRGFIYYDWSVSAGDDTSASRMITQITQAVLSGLSKKSSSTPVVLLHDGANKTSTATACANLLSELSKAGYTCDRLTGSVRPVTFAYNR